MHSPPRLRSPSRQTLLEPMYTPPANDQYDIPIEGQWEQSSMPAPIALQATYVPPAAFLSSLRLDMPMHDETSTISGGPQVVMLLSS